MMKHESSYTALEKKSAAAEKQQYAPNNLEIGYLNEKIAAESCLTVTLQMHEMPTVYAQFSDGYF